MREFKLKNWNGCRIYIKEVLTLTLEEKLKNPNVWKYDNVGDKREVDCEGYIGKNIDGTFDINNVKNKDTKAFYQLLINNKIIEKFRESRNPQILDNNKILCGYIERI